ncbi:hypothetical protein FACS189461_3670 [Spirochaetia bacterium]|nr:hypothetical protein FACS189461_3670 [Spirochaetia bacterium]
MKIKTTQYDGTFYKSENDSALESATILVPMVLNIFTPPRAFVSQNTHPINSVVDFGCGTGAWLSAFQKNGVEQIRGLDGEWVQKDFLKISPKTFTHADFEQKIELPHKYDLAMSLEVAEHLSETAGAQFIDSLTAASNFVLFSAAIPFQGGANHVNEQWPSYWHTLFADRGYIAVDFLRRSIWYDTRIAIHYRQNIMLYVKKEAMHKITVPESDICLSMPPCSFVHHEHYFNLMNWKALITILWKKCFFNFIKRNFRKRRK